MVLILLLFSFTAKEIITNVEDLLRGVTSQGVYKMVLIRPDFRREIRFKFWDDRKGNKTLTIVLSPKKDRGVSYLKIKNNLWMYLPKVKRTIRIPPSMMLNSWMGSDFTNDDVARESSISEDYIPEIIEEKRDTVILKLKPREDLATVWNKIIFKVLLPNIPLESTYYSEKNEPIRKIIFKDLKKFGDRTLPSVMEAIPLNKEGHKTILILEDVKFNERFKGNLFTLENLENMVKKELK
jgi:outer membrane lipoprotein-sorting protein